MGFLRETIPYVANLPLQLMKHHEVRSPQARLFGHRGESYLRGLRIEDHIATVDPEVYFQTGTLVFLWYSVN